MANNNKGKAPAKSASKTTIASSATSDSLTKTRVEWTVQEENFLVEEFSSRKVGL